MTHYETLDVPPNASPQELKRRYRKRAEKAHPDKGGSHEEMAAVNHAYDVLSDPARRLLYDKTGEDSQRPHDEQVRALIVMAFTDGLQHDAASVLDHARAFIKNGHDKLKAQRAELVKQRDKLTARRNKVNVKSGINLFHALIDQNLAQIGQHLARMDEELQLGSDALKELKAYKSDEIITAATIDAAFYRVTMSSSSTSW